VERMSKGHSKQRCQHERSRGNCDCDRALGTSAKFRVHRTRKTGVQEREVAGSEAGGICREHAAKGFKHWAVGRWLSCHLGSPAWPFLLSLFLLTVAGFSRTLYSM